MKLITEADFNDYDIIHDKEHGDHPNTIKIRGVYIQCDKKNGNGRTYSYDMMKPEVDKFIKEYVETGRALGQLEHPDYCEINPSEAAIRITNLEEHPDDRNWIGVSIVLASDPEHGIKGTPKGDIAAALLNYGTKLGFSTRGVGEINEATNEVTEYHLCTIDLVSNPSIGVFCDSNGNRCVNGILESKEFMVNQHGVLVERAYGNLTKKISKLPKKTDFRNALVADAVSEFFKNISHSI